MDPSSSVLDDIRSLRKNGLYLQAWRRLGELSPPETWTDPEWQVGAARVCERVGAANRAQRLILRVWRRNPTASSAAREEVLWVVYSLRGALAAWDWRQRHPLPENAPLRERTDDLAWAAYLLGRLRDFEPAAVQADRAMALEPQSAWPRVVQGWLESWQDRHESALDWFQQARSLHPAGIGGLHALADTLIALGREEEAVAVLEDASARFEAASLAASLAGLHLERGDLAAAERGLDRFAELTPGGEADAVGWLAARRCDLACHRRDYAQAEVQAARVSGSRFYERLAERLGRGTDGLSRRELPVGFVRQHHLTCAPATFTTIARYWGRGVDHLGLAEAICYDGTPYHSERRWAEENGWVTREFTITPEAARTLIDAGMPFTLSTVQPGNAHCQAVIGYDEFRGVLLIRDPYYRSKGEFLTEEGLAGQAPFGPRGLVMAPQAEAARLDGLNLPEAALYDAYHELQLALERHRRDEAAGLQARLESLAPGHRLAWQGAHALACYDGQPSAALAALDALHALFPKEANTQLRRLSRLADLERADERLRQLQAACDAPDSDPLLWLELARALSADARRHPEARRWLKRCLRHRLDAWAVHTEGSLLWDEQAFPQATARFRVAACLDDKNESLVLTYFRAARATGRAGEALAMMRARCAREGGRSSAPARSLAQAYEILDRIEEAMAVLAEAQARRPDDVDLRLHRAQQLATWGREAEAEELLVSSDGRALRPSARSRVLATLAGRRGESAESLAHWRDVLAGEPLAMDAHRAVASLLSEREGAGAGTDHLRRAAAAFPHYQPLQVAVVDWARGDCREDWEQAARQLLHTDPGNAWAHRELALALRAQRRWPEALASVDEAVALDPAQAAGLNIRGLILLDQGRREDGRASLRAGLRLSIDADTAMAPLVNASATPAERLEDLRFLQDELIRQTTTGDAVMTFADLAAPYLEAAELLAFLRQGHEARPDLWQTGVVLARQLARLRRWDEAVEVGAALTRRFPLVPRVWLELGLIHRARPDHAAAVEALGQACQLNPAWPLAMQELASTFRAATRFDDARATMEKAVRHAPADALNHGWLAEFLHHDGEKENALDHVREALRLSPGYEWAWGALDRWGRELGQPDAARLQARELVATRPGEARSWYVLASVLTDRSEFDERLAALDRALALNPRFTAARDEKARHLALAGRFDQALAVCQPDADGAPPPPEIQARAAWILAQKGETAEAIGTMRAALDRDSAQSWGWELLAEWHQGREEWDRAGEAIAHLVRLHPDRAFPHGYLGDLNLQRGDRDGAKREFLRALDIDASYTYGGLNLFDLHLEDREIDAARGVLERLRPHLTAQTAHARDVIHAIFAGDFEGARTAVRELLACREDAPAQVNYALRTLRQQRPAWAAMFSEEARATLARPDPPPHAGTVLAECDILQGRLPGSATCALLPPGAEATTRALDRFLLEIGRRIRLPAGEKTPFSGVAPRLCFRRLRRRYHDTLRASDQTWGHVGYVLYQLRHHRQLCRWMADWPSRPGADPWMLNNLAIAHQVLGHREAFDRISRHVLSLPQHDDTVQRFHLWAALDEALDGGFEAAGARVGGTDPARYDAYDRGVKALLDLVLRFGRAEGPAPAFDGATRATLQSFLESHRGNRLMRTAFTRACALIARRRRSPWPRGWGWTQRHRLVTLLGIILVFVGLRLVLRAAVMVGILGFWLLLCAGGGARL